MTDQKSEQLQENRQPINQACKEKLKQAGEHPDPAGPYLLQLAKWGQEVFAKDQGGDLQYLLNDQLDAMLLQEPKEVVETFYPERDEADNRAAELLRMSPQEAANEVLEDLVLEAIET